MRNVSLGKKKRVNASERYNDKRPVFSVAEYRKLLKDRESTDEQIRKRIEYLELLCRDVIGFELQMYAKNQRKR